MIELTHFVLQLGLMKAILVTLNRRKSVVGQHRSIQGIEPVVLSLEDWALDSLSNDGVGFAGVVTFFPAEVTI